MDMIPSRALFLAGLLAAPALAQTKLATRFAADVSRENPLPEYPRPQWVRENWMSLNGPWQYSIAPRADERPGPSMGEILVPFPIESQLSGVARALQPDQRLWYWRSLQIPASWRNTRLLLHFGAVDWEAQVWINGHFLGEHRGGYDPFEFEIPSTLEMGEVQEIAVGVWDPTDAGTQPRGKQVLEPGGIWYTPTSGIWQSVWLEPVGEVYMDRAQYRVDLASNELHVKVHLVGGNEGIQVRGRVLQGDAVIAESDSEERASDEEIELVLRVPEPRLWSPEDPFLYDLSLLLHRGDKQFDHVTSYFAMRSIALGKDERGIPRLLLNGKPYFQLGLLDQGFWPDGLYTAPTDEALRYDIKMTRSLGFNLARKHVKVEPDRWYTWCDRLGLLVWQDMPSGDAYIGPTDADVQRNAQSARQYERELAGMMGALGNHPCIVSWVVFNEGWGQFDTERLARWVKERDPSRIVNSASGWTDRGVGDVHDVHLYPGPGMAPLGDTRASVLGEFGGLGLPLAGHSWQDEANWGYRSFEMREALTDAYVKLVDELPFLVQRGLCAAVYTQTSDVEIEVNGLLTYDRALVKLDAERVREANRRAFLPPPRLDPVAPAAEAYARMWRWTVDAPGDLWPSRDFDDASWTEGPAGFGSAGTPGAIVRTSWTSGDIWLRRHFTLDRLPEGPLALWIHHDEDVEVYLNGAPLAELSGYRTGYGLVRLDADAREHLLQGDNLLAVHCRQTNGGQYVDLGLVEIVEDGR